MVNRKFILKIFLIFYIILNLLDFFINKTFAQQPSFFVAPTPTDSPTDVSSNISNFHKELNDIVSDISSCGYIGQKCCGRLSMPNDIGFTRIDNFLSNLFLLKGLGVGSLVWSFLSSLITNITPNFFNFVSFLNKIPFIKAYERGYCIVGDASNPYNLDECTCETRQNIKAAQLCNLIKNNEEKNKCFNSCMKDGKGVWTSLGCFSSDFYTLIKEKVFGYGVGLAGFFSFMCIIYSSFLIQTSAGSAEKIKKAQEMLTSCIMGLILIIFSIFVLKLIGINILGIPFLK